MNMNDNFEYTPKVGDTVRVNRQNPSVTGKVKSVNTILKIAEVMLDIDKARSYYFEDLQPVRCPILKVNEPKNLMEIHVEDPKEEQETVELDHLCMPTTQDEIEPIDKGEVVEEVGKFLKLLKSKGWSLDSLNLELCSKNDEEDYVIVNL